MIEPATVRVKGGRASDRATAPAAFQVLPLCKFEGSQQPLYHLTVQAWFRYQFLSFLYFSHAFILHELF